MRAIAAAVLPVDGRRELAQVLGRKRRSRVGHDVAADQGTDRRGPPTLLKRRALAQDGPRAEPRQAPVLEQVNK